MRTKDERWVKRVIDWRPYEGKRAREGQGVDGEMNWNRGSVQDGMFHVHR